jgi:hypothetical protein
LTGVEWSTFRDLPIEAVRSVAPRTVMLCGAGTRRAAMLQGLHPKSQLEYFRWSLLESCASFERWFYHGARDLFICLFRSSQVREGGAYKRGLIPLTIQVLTELADTWTNTPPPYALRTFGDSDFPELSAILERLRAVTDRPGIPRLWWTFFATPSSPYTHSFARLAGRIVHTQAEAIAAIYGSDVEPCHLYVAFGKPILTAELQLPFLIDEAQAMWYQTPGYHILSDSMIRRMIYEAVYTRSTWAEDKGDRYETVPRNRAVWNQPLVLGFGRRMGGFWYPASDELLKGDEA